MSHHKNASQRCAGARSQRGFTMVETMVSLLILSFGILGLAHFQMNMLAQSTDSQQRLAASALSEEVLAYVRSDLSNVGCYTLPQAGACASSFAQSLAGSWLTRAGQSISGFTGATLTVVGANQVSVALKWTSKSSKQPHQHVVTTDVRQ